MRVSVVTWAIVIGMAISPGLACADDTKAAKPGDAKAVKPDDAKAAKPDDAKAAKTAKPDDAKAPKPAAKPDDSASLKKLVDGGKVTAMSIYNGNEKSVNYFEKTALTNEDRALVEKENQKVADRMVKKETNLPGGAIMFAGLRQPIELLADLWAEQAVMPSPTFDRAPMSQGGIYRLAGDDGSFSPLYRPEYIPPTQSLNSSLANQLGLLGILEPADGQQRNRRSYYIFIIRDFRPDSSSLGQMRGLISDIKD